MTPVGGVPWGRHSDQMMHGPDRGKLDQPNTGESDEEDVSTLVSTDTALLGLVVELGVETIKHSREKKSCS